MVDPSNTTSARQGSRGSSLRNGTAKAKFIRLQKEDEQTSGLRILSLKKNHLTDLFGKSLMSCIRFDKYMKVVDISHNRFSTNCLKHLVAQSLRENTSLVSVDVRFNPGASQSILKQVALCMLKNISVHRKKFFTLKDSWVSPKVIQHYEIPEKIYEGLNLPTAPCSYRQG